MCYKNFFGRPYLSNDIKTHLVAVLSVHETKRGGGNTLYEILRVCNISSIKSVCQNQATNFQ